jgi:ABC-2 type transport system ATP-binding protein
MILNNVKEIKVSNLSKTFETKRKTAGFIGSLRALVRPEKHLVRAVVGISLEMEKDELLGFIGPNSGKSTTI